MKLKIFFAIFLIVFLSIFAFLFLQPKLNPQTKDKNLTDTSEDEGGLIDNLNPLAIESLRKGYYPGSEITIEQTLDPGSNYNRYIASYKSEGLKIYALLTIPNSARPPSGWPVIIFNHGFIAPTEYRTTERYVAYQDTFARNGYVTFKSDYRGHGNSEGNPSGAYGSTGYTIDVLNAVSSIKRLGESEKGKESSSSDLTLNALSLPLINPNRIGMWGHSMGGFITLRTMVINKDIKAGVIWSGVVASYPDLISKWRRPGISPPAQLPTGQRGWRQALINQYGTPEGDPAFWNSISANSFLNDISGPLQLHHGLADHSVPPEFSQTLYDQMKKAGKEVELYTYEGNDHNISESFNLAAQRSVEFFNKYLK